MRAISTAQTLLFVVLMAIALGLSVVCVEVSVWRLPLGEFRAIASVVSFVVFFYVIALLEYRIFLAFYPLQEGDIPMGSGREFGYHIYLLFYLVLFQPLTRSLLVPVPLTKPLYWALGARMGANSYSGGVILDPPLTSAGDNCIIGHDAVLFCHAVEGRSLVLAKIRLGDNVTIGAKAVIMPGVTIGSDAVVAVASVVSKGTMIGSGEIWGGIPAVRLRARATE